MAPELKSVSHAGDYRMELSFDDGLTAVVDFAQRVRERGGIWDALRDIEFFKQARVDPELHTIVWPNELDICPDLLYSMASGKPITWVETQNRSRKTG